MLKKIFIGLLAVIFIFLLSICIPISKGREDYSGVLFDSQGELLRVWLNEDGQYKFPKSDLLSEKYRIAARTFEDKRFEKHFGVDVLSVVRAAAQNIKAGHIESGASTITMQTARLKKPSRRTFFAKFLETRAALRMELWQSKDEIFNEYASLVPMGGNVVGAETACWRFFGHSAKNMTWAEAALLAILPNKPSSLNLKKKRAALLERRNLLLKKLYEQRYIGENELLSAMLEELPKSNAEWRFKTPHYAEYMLTLQAGKTGNDSKNLIYGTLDGKVQDKLERLSVDYGKKIREHSNVNIAVLVLETASGKIRGYLGSLDYYDSLSKGMIDGVRARRSTGSILKPFLYGLAIDRGPYTPDFLLEDTPIWFGSFSPRNADMNFSGIVPLRFALTRSLNVPAVRVLADYGVDDFHFWLRKAGLNGLTKSPEHYGLSLILGGSEASLLELAPLYSMLMNNGNWHSVIASNFLCSQHSKPQRDCEGESENLEVENNLLSSISAYHIREILRDVKRPDIDQYYAFFNNQIPVAWKTGTSYGSRDAWAVGVNSQWTIAVWVGNFAGGSVPGLSGAGSAAPLLFSLFNNLTDKSKNMWTEMPLFANSADSHGKATDSIEYVEICELSGYEARKFCPHKKIIALPANRLDRKFCEFHKEVIVSKSSVHSSGSSVSRKNVRNGEHAVKASKADEEIYYEVCSRCWDVNDTLHIVVEHYSPAVRAELRQLGKEPASGFLHNPFCPALKEDFPFSIIYPRNGAKLFLPKGDAIGNMGFVAQAAHKQASSKLQWFLDGKFLGVTNSADAKTDAGHKMPINVNSGAHKISIQDEAGRVVESYFTSTSNPASRAK